MLSPAANFDVLRYGICDVHVCIRRERRGRLLPPHRPKLITKRCWLGLYGSLFDYSMTLYEPQRLCSVNMLALQESYERLVCRAKDKTCRRLFNNSDILQH